MLSHMMTVGSSLGCAGQPATPLYSPLCGPTPAADCCGVMGSCGLYVSGDPGMGGEPIRMESPCGASWSVVERLACALPCGQAGMTTRRHGLWCGLMKGDFL